MSQVFLLSARMHPNTDTGYEIFGQSQNPGPKRQGVRVLYSSCDGENIDSTELAVSYLDRDGSRNADYMREASFTGSLSPRNIFKAANVLRKVTDRDIQKFGDFPTLIKKALDFADSNICPAPIESSEDFRQALQMAIQEHGCVYCDPDTKSTALERVESALVFLPPAEWSWNDSKQRYEFTIFFDCDAPDTPFNAEDVCILTFSESECPTIGPMWRFDANNHLIAGFLPDPEPPQEPQSCESFPAPSPGTPRSGRHAAKEHTEKQANLPHLLRWVSVIVLIAVATAALALASSTGVTDKAIYLRISLSSAKPLLFAIYGLVVGLLIGHKH